MMNVGLGSREFETQRVRHSISMIHTVNGMDGANSKTGENDPIVELLLSGQADTVHEAEELYLDEHIADVVRLAESPLTEDQFRRHPLIALLLAHGSRPWEDSLA
jgi:hypothetical protein